MGRAVAMPISCKVSAGSEKVSEVATDTGTVAVPALTAVMTVAPAEDVTPADVPMVDESRTV